VLDVTGGGERLHHEVTFEDGAQPVFAIVNQHGTVILSKAWPPDENGVYGTTWPDDPAAIEIPNGLMHTLSLHFIFATKYRWRVTRVDEAGDELEVLKECTYESEPHSSEDEWFSPIRIFTS
jgi:hypothetical protein